MTIIAKNTMRMLARTDMTRGTTRLRTLRTGNQMRKTSVRPPPTIITKFVRQP